MPRSSLRRTRMGVLEYESASWDDIWAKDDIWAWEVIRKRLKVQSGTILQFWDKTKRNDALKQLMEEGLSIRQIERLTGISRGVIQKIKR